MPSFYNPLNPPPGLLDELADVWSNWNPALINDPMGPDIYHLVNFIKALYFDSQVTVGLLSNITGFLPVFVEGIPPTPSRTRATIHDVFRLLPLVTWRRRISLRRWACRENRSGAS
jgi:hypothetical protein